MFEAFTAMGEPQGGDAGQMRRLSEALKEAGCQVQVVSYPLSRVLLYRDLQFLLKFARIGAKDFQGDVLYSIGAPFTAVMSAILGHKLGVPTVHHVTHLGGDFNTNLIEALSSMKVGLSEGGMKFVVANLGRSMTLPFLTLPELVKSRALIRWGLRHVSQIVCSSEYLRQGILRMLPGNRDIPIIYPWIEPVPLPPPNLGANSKTVFYFGALYSGRGVLDLIRAFGKVLEEVPDARLVIAGHPAYEGATDALARLLVERVSAEAVSLVGYQQDIWRALGEATVVCLPFRYDKPFQPPLTLLEAMMAAKPVVTTKSGASPEFICDNDTGFLVAPRDIDALAKKLCLLLTQKEAAVSMGNRARERVLANCDPHLTSRQILKLLEETVNGRVS
ncbi:MAG: glycosyltransferase family 4 protein [Chloroflexi bacterium]|nr:glycosyltransferase family 4 protein [Chloroflexota bacterium]